MAVRLKFFRRGTAQIMDMFGDMANVTILLVVIASAWKCWSAFFSYLDKAGGLPAIPRSEQEWVYLGTVLKMMFLDPNWRGVIVAKAQGWSMAWVMLILATALTILAVAGLRWGWIRLRDVVAGA